MADISAQTPFSIYFLDWNWLHFIIQISLRFAPEGPVHNELVVLLDTKPLAEPIMTQPTDAYMHHKASMS